jgi:eukaryotic-like serine/threonine-protein kinase
VTAREDRFRAAMALVDRALDVPVAERAALLLRECHDPEVREEAERLLDADDRAGDFLSSPAGALTPGALASLERSAARSETGALVGPFRLVEILGKGGMGEVWVAVRVGADFEQKVAVKLLPGTADVTSEARFRRERQILARLTHPRIARLLDGGVTPDGRAWLAMELVVGKGLMEHAAEHDLDVDARLRLFVEICGAVQFAHQNLVVHRDLKPSNILVTASGEPKLLDFGIAKLLEEGDRDDLTRTNERPMTLDYAAPEQVRGDVVTTASDVWALGAILHELLTGLRPYRTTGKNRGETERAILAAAPSRPSTQIDGGPVRGRPTARSPDVLRQKLRGDLDAIVLKAMRADPKDRYPSAEALGADVRRHLERAPVSARGEATSYLIRAMVRRHRAAFAFSAAVLATLVVGLLGTLWQARRAREETRKAERAEDFLVSLLRAFDPDTAGGKPITQRDILGRGEARVDELESQPEVQARLLQVFAETWYGLEEYERARLPAERALAIERRRLGPRSLEVAKTLDLLGSIDFDQGHIPEAARLYTEALDIAREAEGKDGVTVASCLNDLAGVERREYAFAEAERLRREALDIYRRELGPENAKTVGVMNDLGVLTGDEGHFAESATIQAEACALLAKTSSDDHPATLICRYNLARDLLELGRAEEAETMLEDARDRTVRVLGESWAEIPAIDTMRGRALDRLGKPGHALELFDGVIAGQEKKLGAENLELAPVHTRKALALLHLERLSDAEASARRALGICLAQAHEELAYTARARAALGEVLLQEGHARDAEDALTLALAAQVKTLGPKHPETLRTQAAHDRAAAAASK